jgi:hypothetical protein
MSHVMPSGDDCTVPDPLPAAGDTVNTWSVVRSRYVTWIVRGPVTSAKHEASFTQGGTPKPLNVEPVATLGPNETTDPNGYNAVHPAPATPRVTVHRIDGPSGGASLTLPDPFPAPTIVTGNRCGSSCTVACRLWYMTTAQVSEVDAQSPVNPRTFVSSLGVAVSCTVVPTAKSAVHAPVPPEDTGFAKSQSIPAGLDVTRARPKPPPLLTARVTISSATGAKFAMTAGTLGGKPGITLHVSVPAHAPDQPMNLLPGAGEALSVNATVDRSSKLTPQEPVTPSSLTMQLTLLDPTLVTVPVPPRRPLVTTNSGEYSGATIVVGPVITASHLKRSRHGGPNPTSVVVPAMDAGSNVRWRRLL